MTDGEFVYLSLQLERAREDGWTLDWKWMPAPGGEEQINVYLGGPSPACLTFALGVRWLAGDIGRELGQKWRTACLRSISATLYDQGYEVEYEPTRCVQGEFHAENDEGEGDGPR
jgi:hypothetical protein